MNSATLVRTALEGTVGFLAAEYKRQLLVQYDTFAAELAADGMDARIRFSYPEGSCSKATYLRQKARYDYCMKYTQSTLKFSRGAHGPDPRAFRYTREELDSLFEAEAWKQAEGAVSGYSEKLGAKIDETGETVVGVKYQGGADVWGFSHVLVSTTAGQQVWRTRMILNTSCLGTLFNQWPTRRIS